MSDLGRILGLAGLPAHKPEVVAEEGLDETVVELDEAPSPSDWELRAQWRDVEENARFLRSQCTKFILMVEAHEFADEDSEAHWSYAHDIAETIIQVLDDEMAG